MSKLRIQLLAGILTLGALLQAPLAQAQGQPGASAAEQEDVANFSEDETTSAQSLDKFIMLDPAREIKVTSGVVGPEETLMSIPYLYRRTAVLTEDLISHGPAFRYNQELVSMKAGAVGYWAGRYKLIRKNIVKGTPLASDYSDVWCFFDDDGRRAPRSICVATNEDYDYELPSTNSRWEVPEISFLSVLPIKQLKFEERPVRFKVDLRLEYRLWKRESGDLGLVLYADDEWPLAIEAAIMQPDGSLQSNTLAGTLSLTQTSNLGRVSNVKLTQEATNMSPKRSPIIKLSELTPPDRQRYVDLTAEMLEKAREKLSFYQSMRIQPLDVSMVGEDREGFFPVKWRDVVLRRAIRPARLYVQKSSPRNQPKQFGPPNAVLFSPINEFGRNLLCLNASAQITQQVKVDKKSRHCIEDRDGDGKYEWVGKDVGFFGTPGLMTSSLMNFESLEQTGAVEVETAPSQTIEAHNFNLVATGISRQARTNQGKYRPSEYRFSLREISEPSKFIPFLNSRVIRNYNVALDSNGTGELRSADGTMLIEVRNARMDGSAEVKLHGILKPGIGPIFDPSFEINRLRKVVAASEILAANASEDKDLDPSILNLDGED